MKTLKRQGFTKNTLQYVATDQYFTTYKRNSGEDLVVGTISFACEPRQTTDSSKSRAKIVKGFQFLTLQEFKRKFENYFGSDF